MFGFFCVGGVFGVLGRRVSWEKCYWQMQDLF